MESKKINLSKIFNIVAILLGIILLATLIGASIFAPVANVQAITKSEILNTYNIHFVTSKTDSSVTTGLTANNNVSDKDGNKFTKYKYNRATNNVPNKDGKIFYYGDYGATSYSDAYGSYILEEDNTSALLLKQNTSFKNNEFIPTNTTHYINVNNQYEEIFYDDTIENGFVFLDNYNLPTQQYSNYENFYLAFGSPYSENETHNYVRSFTVSGTLYNTSGEEHTLYLNPVSNDKIGNDNSKSLTYWYQYFDLTNIQGDNGTTTPYDILNQEGKYEITFKDILYYDNNGNPSTLGNNQANSTYTYTFYLLDSANYAYPKMENTAKSTTLANAPVEYYSQKGKNNSNITYSHVVYLLSNNKEILTKAQTFAFSTLALSQLFHSFGIKRMNQSLFTKETFNNGLLIISLFFGILIQYLVTTVPFLSETFKTSILSTLEFVAILNFSIIPLIIHQVIHIFKK
jgi:hypothetical protein